MINGKSVLALIPARGGSKRLPKKNLKELAGKSLIEWTANSALEAKHVDRVVVSTDCSDIAREAKRLGVEVPFMRPSEIANDTASTESVILHAVKELPNEACEIVVILQPTSPLRLASDIDQAIEKMVASEAEGVVSVLSLIHI